MLLRVLLLVLLPLLLQAQGPPPIGQWREHLPWNNAIALASSGSGEIIAATPFAAFRYKIPDNEFQRRSRVNGLSDIGVAAMARDAASGKTVIAYNNSNIDVWDDGGKILNIPDIRISNTQANRRINRISVRNDKAYLSAGLGVIILDLRKNEVDDTWRIGPGGNELSVNGLAFAGGNIYAATDSGLRACPLNLNPADFRNWSTIPLAAGPIRQVISSGGIAYALKGDSLLRVLGTTASLFYRAAGISGVDSTSGGGLLVSGSAPAEVVQLNVSGSVTTVYRSPLLSLPRQALLLNGDCWVADQNNGLLKISGGSTERVFPNSPINIATGQMSFIGKDLWAGAGTVNDAWNYTFNPNGVYRMKDQFWDGYNLYVYPKLDSVLDIITVAGRPGSGSVFAGSYGGGLLEIRENNELVIYKQNSPLRPAIGDPGSYRVSGLAFDPDGNLWISNFGAPQNLHVKKADGSWRSFTIPFFHIENALSSITIDELDQKWIVSPKGNGLFVYNSGSSIDNTGDDRWRYYRQGRGAGNLPSSNVYCAVRDRNGFIWVGTEKGIAVINCIDKAVENSCEAILPVIQQGSFAGFLFGDEEVLCMAVDGANRKWVGTRNGLWLVSAEGDAIIFRFDRSNSPLLSNEINALAIDPATGEVFIATSAGICSFRSTATEPAAEVTNVQVYPNPVPPGFTGSIGIRGLPENAVVKITELDGRLVYQTRSLGGQAIWNGKDARGNRASSGVYLIFVANQQNRERAVGKVFFLK